MRFRALIVPALLIAALGPVPAQAATWRVTGEAGGIVGEGNFQGASADVAVDVGGVDGQLGTGTVRITYRAGEGVSLLGVQAYKPSERSLFADGVGTDGAYYCLTITDMTGGDPDILGVERAPQAARVTAPVTGSACRFQHDGFVDDGDYVFGTLA